MRDTPVVHAPSPRLSEDLHAAMLVCDDDDDMLENLEEEAKEDEALANLPSMAAGDAALAEEYSRTSMLSFFPRRRSLPPNLSLRHTRLVHWVCRELGGHFGSHVKGCLWVVEYWREFYMFGIAKKG